MNSYGYGGTTASPWSGPTLSVADAASSPTSARLLTPARRRIFARAPRQASISFSPPTLARAPSRAAARSVHLEPCYRHPSPNPEPEVKNCTVVRAKSGARGEGGGRTAPEMKRKWMGDAEGEGGGVGSSALVG